MTSKQTACFMGVLVMVCYTLVLSGVWVTGWYLSAKLIITALITLVTGGIILETIDKGNK